MCEYIESWALKSSSTYFFSTTLALLSSCKKSFDFIDEMKSTQETNNPTYMSLLVL